jgi:hypothetical protein
VTNAEKNRYAHTAQLISEGNLEGPQALREEAIAAFGRALLCCPSCSKVAGTGASAFFERKSAFVEFD